MTPDKVSTHALPAPDQLEAWRGWYHPVFEVTPRQREELGFYASSQFWTLNGFSMCRVSAPPLNAQRTKALIRANPVDHWVVTLGQRATTIVRPRNGWFEAPPGVPFVLSLGEEFESEREQDDRLQLYLPRDNFREIAPLLDGAKGHVLNSPFGRLLGDYLLLLERHLPELASEDLLRLTRAVGAMVASCIAPTSDRLATAASQIDLGRLERVRQVISKHLRSPVLGTNMLCREVGMSRSQLYRLLEGEGGVARYIQRQRLLESHAALSDPSNSLRITTIADALCFAGASSFSRAFRQEFGESPTNVRAATLAGLPLRAAPRTRTEADTRNFSDCLKAF